MDLLSNMGTDVTHLNYYISQGLMQLALWVDKVK